MGTQRSCEREGHVGYKVSKRKKEKEGNRGRERERKGEARSFEITCQLESEISSRTNQQLNLSRCARMRVYLLRGRKPLLYIS